MEAFRNVTRDQRKRKSLTALVGRLSLSVGWEKIVLNGDLSFNP